ncbi:MAG: BPL-N domain-containing protein [Hyphomicrobiales bacterium]
MKKNNVYVLLLSFIAFFMMSCSTKNEKVQGEPDVKSFDTSGKIKVGVFNRNGDSPICIVDAVEALKIDKDIIPQVISAADIMSDKLDQLDVVLFPGGGGKSETNSLGQKGIEKIREYVLKKGKGVIGICAGAYILTATSGYPSLDLSAYKAIDIEHDHRGNGLVKFNLTSEGEKIFPELKDREISYCNYYEGPVLEAINVENVKSSSLSTMLSDVHLIEGTPADMTNNKPFVVVTDAGKGRTASFVGHPESTPGMRWMIPRIARYVAKRDFIQYNSSVVRPETHTKEILFDKEKRTLQRKLYNDLFKTPEEKINAIHEITSLNVWSAKKYFMGMLRDFNPEVRQEAAKALVQLERTDAIYDVEVALSQEKNVKTKAVLEESLNKLKSMIGNQNLLKDRELFVVHGF